MLLIANRKDRLILFSVQCVISVDYINYGGNLLEKLHRITSMRVSVRNKNNTTTFVRRVHLSVSSLPPSATMVEGRFTLSFFLFFFLSCDLTNNNWVQGGMKGPSMMHCVKFNRFVLHTSQNRCSWRVK